MALSPPGIILVSHEVLGTIGHEEMLAAIPKEYRGLPHHHVSLTTVKTTLAELGDFDWITARNTQELEVKSKLLPYLEDHAGWRIQYFGAAPIPLAMALGFQLSKWTDVDTYQKLHEGAQSWGWPSSETSPDILESSDASQERLLGEGDVVIRVSLSHVVHTEDTAPTIPAPLGEIDVKARTPNEDLLRSPHDLATVIAAFGDALDRAHEFRPKAQIHVFAAVTVGAAFRMGASVNPTIHGDVQTYQYFGSHSPRYQRAFVLQRSAQPGLALTDGDREACRGLRNIAEQELERLKDWISGLPDGSDWIATIFPSVSAEGFSAGLRKLDPARETPLMQSSVDLTTTDVEDGFAYDVEGNRWQLGDQLLNALLKRIPDEDEQRLAIRLFLLHEAIHRGSHHLRQSRQVGRFPKVVEELDYQADVWAYLHEAARLSLIDGKSLREALIGIIKRAIDTFWAFASTDDPSRIQVRMVNRYLIWYWKKLEIEKLTDASHPSEFLSTLADKPVVEISGASIRTINDRVWFLLDQVTDAEIAVLWRARLNRAGHGLGTPVADIFKGFRERSDQMITQALRSIADMFTDS